MTEQAQEPQKLDRKDLKILALKQELSDKSELIADLRAELTETVEYANEQIRALVDKVQELENPKQEEDEDEVSDEEEPDTDSDTAK